MNGQLPSIAKTVLNKLSLQVVKLWQMYVPAANLRNLWLLLCGLTALQSLIVFNNTQITGNAITALIVWGGALICMEDHIENMKPNPSKRSLFIGVLILLYVLYRTAVISGTDSFLYLLPPVAGLGLFFLTTPLNKVFRFGSSLLVLCLLPIFVLFQILVTRYITDDLSTFTARFVMLWLSVLGVSPIKLINDTVFVNGGAVQVMHECNGFEMIMQMIITAFIFLLAFPLRSRIGKFVIVFFAPIIGFMVNSLRIALLAIFTSLNSANGKALFDFFHEQAGSLIFSGIAVFILGYLYLSILNRELPPIIVE
jgi:cyanoexosortase A